jgi:hypothetical protein
MALTIPSLPHPSSMVVDDTARMTREWYGKLDELIRALQQRVPLTGTAIFAAGTSIAVTFATAEVNTSYNVLIDAPANLTFWVTSKATTGFTINASASNSETVGWALTRR